MTTALIVSSERIRVIVSKSSFYYKINGKNCLKEKKSWAVISSKLPFGQFCRCDNFE